MINRTNLGYCIDKNNIQELIDKHKILISTIDISDFSGEQLSYRKIIFEKQDKFIQLIGSKVITNIPEK